ncbi:hypothetical protein ALTERO38_90242 [Alteromonas sp. 38]|nr:hypothetical protein ALTERO38_90242 [Alteromonas sp. 38]
MSFYSVNTTHEDTQKVISARNQRLEQRLWIKKFGVEGSTLEVISHENQ